MLTECSNDLYFASNCSTGTRWMVLFVLAAKTSKHVHVHVCPPSGSRSMERVHRPRPSTTITKSKKTGRRSLKRQGALPYHHSTLPSSSPFLSAAQQLLLLACSSSSFVQFCQSFFLKKKGFTEQRGVYPRDDRCGKTRVGVGETKSDGPHYWHCYSLFFIPFKSTTRTRIIP